MLISKLGWYIAQKALHAQLYTHELRIERIQTDK